MDETLNVRPWPDHVIDTIGHDPRSWYAETFWLPTLGPTALLLMRRFADGFDRNQQGFVITLQSLSIALGLGDKASIGGPVRKAMQRLEHFSLTVLNGDGALLVRRNLAPIHRKHIGRLPTAVRSLHHEVAEQELLRPINETANANARRRALCLVSEGESPDCAERALLRIGYPPSISRQAVAWATRRNVEASNAAAMSPAHPSHGAKPSAPEPQFSQRQPSEPQFSETQFSETPTPISQNRAPSVAPRFPPPPPSPRNNLVAP